MGIVNRVSCIIAVHPRPFAQDSPFLGLCCDLLRTLPISFRITSQVPGQSDDYPFANEVTLIVNALRGSNRTHTIIITKPTKGKPYPPYAIHYRSVIVYKYVYPIVAKASTAAIVNLWQYRSHVSFLQNLIEHIMFNDYFGLWSNSNQAAN